MYHYRARYYGAYLQRFISEDPIGFVSGSVNHYAYVGNDPANAVDPLGLLEWYDLVVDLPTLPPDLADFVTGFGDAFLIPELVRDSFGIQGAINKCSTAYKAGKIVGFVEGSIPFVLRGAATVGGTRAGHLLNHNRYFRIGPGNMPKNGPGLPSGPQVPRMVFGPDKAGLPKPPHFDLRSRIPYAPPLGGPNIYGRKSCS